MSQVEDNKLLYTLFDDMFFSKWTKDNVHGSVELNITADCNYKCEYCYLYRHGDKLYPKELRSPSKIKENAKIFFDWVQKNNYFIYTLDIFSGEFFAGKLGLEILDIIYEANKKKQFCYEIVIPSNCSFVYNDEYAEKVDKFYKKFKDLGIQIFISCSIDGGPIDEQSRASKVTIDRDESYYDKLFKYGVEHNFGYHPMVGRTFLKNYKENYDWWIEKIKKYYPKEEWGSKKPMFLEIRNDEWDAEDLDRYNKFLWYMVEKDIEVFHNGNVEEEAFRVFNTANNKVFAMNEIARLPYTEPRMSCAIQFYPCVRLGDLVLNPCHRTSYPGLNYGKFIVEDNSITGLEAWNTPLAVKIYSMNPNVTHPKCSACPIKAICSKGCLGAQLESTGELFSPIESVCNLMYTKVKTLIEIFDYYHFQDYVEKSNEISYDEKQDIARRLNIMRSI